MISTVNKLDVGRGGNAMITIGNFHLLQRPELVGAGVQRMLMFSSLGRAHV